MVPNAKGAFGLAALLLRKPIGRTPALKAVPALAGEKGGYTSGRVNLRAQVRLVHRIAVGSHPLASLVGGSMAQLVALVLFGIVAALSTLLLVTEVAWRRR